METWEILSLIQNHAPVIGLVIFMYYWPLKDSLVKYPVLFLLSSYLVNVLVGSYAIGFIGGRFIISLWGLFQVALISTMYYQFSDKQRIFKTLGIFFFTTLLVIQIIFEEPNKVPANTLVLDEIIVLFLSLCFFAYVYISEKEIDLLRSKEFIMASIIFIYTAGGFFTQLMVKFVTKNKGEFAYLWNIQNILSILAYLALAWVIWQTGRRTRAIGQ